MESLISFTESNDMLTSLRLTSNRLESISVEALCRTIQTDKWARLATVDLSFNRLDLRGTIALTGAVKINASVTTLKLAGCGVTHNLAHIIAT